jgi:shikimate kinase
VTAPGNPDGVEPAVLPQTVVLVGLMGAGKTAIGKRLAARLGLPFVDADVEIEAAAGCTIEEYFLIHGEAAFRDGERRVIGRLLERPVQILAAGGGAFVDPITRALMRGRVISVWLRAELEVLVARTARRNNRPLLKQGEAPRDVLDRLITLRNPIYAEADLTVDSVDCPLEEMVDRVLAALERHLGRTLATTAPLPETVEDGSKSMRVRP